MKYILVTGSVISGLGKGIISASIATCLQQCGFQVTNIKIDPYLNTSADCLRPQEHGEAFVTRDGGVCDLDIGTYERFTGNYLTKDHNITTGKIYKQVIDAEVKGDYGGATVQVIPHVTTAIISWIERVSRIVVSPSGKLPEICIVELGGCVGDIESAVYYEAFRQLAYKVQPGDFCHLHLSLVVTVGTNDEPKTKPVQHSLQQVRALGLTPNFIICRSKKPIDVTKNDIRQKIGLYGMIPFNHVILVPDVQDVNLIPAHLEERELPLFISSSLKLHPRVKVEKVPALLPEVRGEELRVGLVGKYIAVHDAYLSIINALQHASIKIGTPHRIIWIDADDLVDKESVEGKFKGLDAVIIPGGFGLRGIDGKLLALEYCRTTKLPTLGICLGMQLMCIEFARSLPGYKNATSEEFEEKHCDGERCEREQHEKQQIIIHMPEIKLGSLGKLSGTMRLGSRTTRIIKRHSLAHKYYQRQLISERHRHRYEVNPAYVEKLEENGLNFVGTDGEIGNRMEIVELDTKTHPFYVGTQFHPEFESGPMYPAPLFVGLLEAAREKIL